MVVVRGKAAAPERVKAAGLARVMAPRKAGRRVSVESKPGRG